MCDSRERIEAMMVKLKDTSEMMIDLAYSSLLFSSVEIAQQVLELEEEVDKLHTEFELAVLELTDSRPPRGVLGLIRLSLAAENFADAATLIADAVVKGVKPHPVFMMALEEAEETILATKIAEDSPLVNKSLSDIGLKDDIGMRVICIRRGKKWTYNPLENFVLKGDDTIVVRGFSEGKKKILFLADPHKR